MVGECRRGRGRASRGSTQASPAYLQPEEEKGKEGVDRGMDRNACGGEEKDILQLQNSSSRLTVSEGDRVSIFSLGWSSLDMLLM